MLRSTSQDNSIEIKNKNQKQNNLLILMASKEPLLIHKALVSITLQEKGPSVSTLLATTHKLSLLFTYQQPHCGVVANVPQKILTSATTRSRSSLICRP